MVGWLTFFLVYLFTNDLLLCLSNSLVTYLAYSSLRFTKCLTFGFGRTRYFLKREYATFSSSKTMVMLEALFSEQEESTPKTDNFCLGDS